MHRSLTLARSCAKFSNHGITNVRLSRTCRHPISPYSPAYSIQTQAHFANIGSCISKLSGEPQSPSKANTAATIPVKSTSTKATAAGAAMASSGTTKIYIIYYSMYGHIKQLAEAEKAGVDSVPGCEGVLFQVKETLPEEVTAKMHAPPQDASIPFITAAQLPEADGFLFGFPTRYGNMAAQFKTFWDSTGQLWTKQALAGKAFGTFISTATQGGGQEFTHASALSNFVHHGMIYVPIGSTFGPELFDNSTLHGSSPWGASTYANGDGSRQPSQLELDVAKYQGKYAAEKIKLLAGKA